MQSIHIPNNFSDNMVSPLVGPLARWTLRRCAAPGTDPEGSLMPLLTSQLLKERLEIKWGRRLGGTSELPFIG